MRRLLLSTLILAFCQPLFAQENLPPKWIHRQVFIGDKCDFVLVKSEGETNARAARVAALVDLRDKLVHTDVVSVNQSYSSNTHERFMSKDMNVHVDTAQEDDSWIEILVEGSPTPIRSKRIDEYCKMGERGLVYYALIAVPQIDSQIDLSRLALTTDYSSDPTTWPLSLIPGAAQMHKGDYVKGGIIMGGTVALVGGTIVFDRLRSGYRDLIEQTHHAATKKTYNNRAVNSTTARNVCIGGLAALYVYNILDALIAPGARRVIVTPAATAEGQYGMAVTYSF